MTDSTRRHVYFHIADWIACTRDGAGEWKSWARAEPAREPAGPLPVLLRRRVSKIGQLAFEAINCLPDHAQTRFIFCSRHGEFDRTLRLLDSIAEAQPLSPADFSLSVHHALAALLAMARQNRGGHTAVAAGPDSFGAGMIEALGCLATQPESPVALVYYDDPLPGAYAGFEPGFSGLAVALLLEPARGDADDVTFDLKPGPADDARHTPSQALEFVGFLQSGERECNPVHDRFHWSRRHVA